MRKTSEIFNAEHDLTLWYYVEDDGIYLVCQSQFGRNGCGWEKHLGFTPSVDEVIEAKNEHDEHVFQEGCK